MQLFPFSTYRIASQSPTKIADDLLHIDWSLPCTAQIWLEALGSKHFCLNSWYLTFQYERFDFAINPLFHDSFALNFLFLKFVEAHSYVSISSFDPSSDSPIDFFLLIPLILDFPLDAGDYFEYFPILISFILKALKEFVFLLIQLSD